MKTTHKYNNPRRTRLTPTSVKKRNLIHDGMVVREIKHDLMVAVLRSNCLAGRHTDLTNKLFQKARSLKSTGLTTLLTDTASNLREMLESVLATRVQKVVATATYIIEIIKIAEMHGVKVNAELIDTVEIISKTDVNEI